MQLKHFFIASLLLSVALLSLVFMQKGGYVSQAKTTYEKRTTDYFNKASMVIGGQNEVIAKNAVLWHIACEAQEQAKTSKDFATIEKKLDFNKIILAPQIKTDKATGYLTRKVGWNADYYIVASFDKASSALMNINVDALLGKAPVQSAEEALEEDAPTEE